MHPAEAQRGDSSRSELLSSLKVYLNNKNRLQPIIGLGSIIECVKVGTCNKEVLYLCVVCFCRLSKADMRNHIIGSLHRYNYIKAYYSSLVSKWKENSDLSKLAWPLMEIAKTIEGKEGAGDVQLFEVEDAVYQKMATHSENDAVTMINYLRDWHDEPVSPSETTSLQMEQRSNQSQRIVLLSGKSLKAGMISHKTSSTQTNKPPHVMQSPAGRLKNISPSHNTLMSPEASALSERNNSFLNGYTGTMPLIGLVRVVECRSEDGDMHVFLCHCCRIRSNKEDIIDHLTSSSHLTNYLTEKHPEQMDVITANINDNCQLIQSLARKVEQEEGRGELKVINVPESLSIPMTGKSYHWCIKILCNGLTLADTHKSKITGSSRSKASVEGKPEKHTAVLLKRTKRKAKKKVKKVANTVFNVSLPLTKGLVLLERMAFCEDSPPISDSHSAASDLTPSPQTENCELDYDIEQEFYSGDAEADQYMGPERIFTDTPYQGEDGSFSINEDFRQADDVTCTNNQKVYGEGNYGTWHASQETSLKNFGNLQKEELSHAVHNTQDWASQNSSYRPEDGYASQWYSSAPQNQVGTREKELKEEKWEMSLAAAQSYHQQQPQNQYMAADHPSRLTSSAGHHGSPGESNYLNAAWNNEYPRLDLSAHSGSIAPQPRVQSLETEQRYQRTYMEFTNSHVHTTPQSYMAQPPAYQGIYIGHGVMSVPDYSYDLNYSNLCYGAYSDHSYRDTGLPGLMPRSVGGAPPFMSTYPNLNSAYVATPYGDQSSARGSGVPIE